MTKKHIGIARQMSYVLADRDMASAPSLGDMADILKLRTGCALGERCRDIRNELGHDLRCFSPKGEKPRRYLYFLPVAERKEIRASEEYKAWKAHR